MFEILILSVLALTDPGPAYLLVGRDHFLGAQQPHRQVEVVSHRQLAAHEPS